MHLFSVNGELISSRKVGAPVCTMCVTHDTSLVMAGDEDGMLAVYEVPSLTHVRSIASLRSRGPLRSIALMDDVLFCGCADGSLLVASSP